MPLLEVSNLRVSYGKALAIESVSIKVEKGELVGVLGPNGAGKTTLLKAISRSIASQGTLTFKGESLAGVEPYDVVARGICHCPEGRKLFSELSVLKNLQLGAYLRKNNAEIEADLERVFTLFPVLRERQWQQSSTLSGGEQQMVAIARALMARPKLLLLDEPSLGLSPKLVKEIFEIIKRVNAEEGTTMLLVEQNANIALSTADYGYVLEVGRVVMQDTRERLLEKEDIKEFYLGMKADNARGERRWKKKKQWR